MSKFWSPVVQALSPYTPGEQPRVDGLIKLNTNEHPLPPSSRALDAMSAQIGEGLRRYPDPEATALRAAIAQTEGLDVSQVFVGNGSDEVIAHCFQALLAGQERLAIPDITYSFYPVWAGLYGVFVQPLALKPDFSVDVDAFARSTAPIILANPNAPTGMALSLGDIGRLAESRADRLVVIDEAYFGFGADTAASLLSQFDNLLITRSLSKSHALAGLRVGYALGSPELIEGLVRVKDSFNSYPLDAIAQAGAAAAITDRKWFSESTATVCNNRTRLTEGLMTLGFGVCPSLANFVFATHSSQPGADIFQHLREHNILVRRWDKPRIADYLRISVGTESECDELLACLRNFLQ